MIRVLVIDDEKSFTSILAMNIEAAGDFEVRCLNDPRDAFETAVQWEPHIILLDMIMPQMSGEDIFAQLRGHEDLKELPIILLSASDCSSSIIRGANVEHLPKPMSADQILSAINKHVARSSPPQSQETNTAL